jgi:hypothetical protein
MADSEAKRRIDWRTWVFAAVPAFGLFELTLHFVQMSSVVSDADWSAAKEVVESLAKPEDLVTYAPAWVGPVAREHFGPQIATLEREARPDDTRFPQAIEVSIRGQRLPELDGWRLEGERHVGAVTIRTLENPAPVKLKDDLLLHVRPDEMSVAVDHGGEHECLFGRGGAVSGGLGSGTATPSERFSCPGGGAVGVTILPAIDYTPHRCLSAPPAGSGGVTRIRFASIAFGTVLHGHHGIAVEQERDKKGPPVTLAFRVPEVRADGAADGRGTHSERIIGKVVHIDGDGWKPFELDTRDLDGQKGELVAEVTSSGAGRQYCFEADTR